MGGKREESKIVPKFLNLGYWEDVAALNMSLKEKKFGGGW